MIAANENREFLVGASDAHKASAPEQSSGLDSRRYNRLIVPRLTPEQRFAFEEISPTALCIYANLAGAQPRYWGDNQGGWPVLMRLSQVWEDKHSATLLAADAYQERALIGRYWFDEWDEGDRTWCATYQGLRQHFDDGRGEWMSFCGDEAGLALIDEEIRGRAREHRAEIWTDAEMVSRFDWLIAAARKVGETT